MDTQGSVNDLVVIDRQTHMSGWVENQLHGNLAAADAARLKRGEVAYPQARLASGACEQFIEDTECVAGPPTDVPVFALLQPVKLIHDDDRYEHMDGGSSCLDHGSEVRLFQLSGCVM